MRPAQEAELRPSRHGGLAQAVRDEGGVQRAVEDAPRVGTACRRGERHFEQRLECVAKQAVEALDTIEVHAHALRLERLGGGQDATATAGPRVEARVVERVRAGVTEEVRIRHNLDAISELGIEQDEIVETALVDEPAVRVVLAHRAAWCRPPACQHLTRQLRLSKEHHAGVAALESTLNVL